MEQQRYHHDGSGLLVNRASDSSSVGDSLLDEQHPSSSSNLDDGGCHPGIPEGGFAVLNSVAVDGAGSWGVSAALFDNQEELVWTGNSGGHVTSYFGSTLDKYTSFQVVPRNPSQQLEIRSLLTSDAGVLALSQQRLKCNKRQGMGVFTYTSGNFVDVQCMDFSPVSETNIVLGGFQQTLVQLDLGKLVENRVVRINQQDCTILRTNEQLIFSGDTQGNVTLRNPKNLEGIHVLEAHNGSLSDFDVCGMKLVTCGFSYRLGQLQCDRFLMLYDLRTLRAQRPIPLNFEPSFIRFLPTYSDNRLVVASQCGEFQVFEIGELTGYPFRLETEGSGVFCLDVSPSKQCIAMGDGAGFLHLFSDRAQPVFNECPVPTEFPDPVPPLAPMSFEDLLTPYAMIPLPLPENGSFLSDWPPHLCRRVYRQPVPVDPEILKSMKVSQFVGYARNPGTRLRNQVPYDLHQPSGFTALMTSDSSSSLPPGEVALSDSFSAKTSGEESGFQVPKLYRKMAVKPGKFGGDEAGAAKFWRNYNQTGLSGLESLVPNSYGNAVLLVLYHIIALRNSVMSHLCRNEFCLTCELSFLFKMLSQAAGKQPCSGNNFVRAFRAIPEASGLGLVLNDRDDGGILDINWSEKIQSFNRFLLQQLHKELESGGGRPGSRVPGARVFMPDLEEEPLSSPEKDDSAFETSPRNKRTEDAKKSRIRDLFSLEFKIGQSCKCGEYSHWKDTSLVLSLDYPSEEEGKLKEKMELESLVKKSLSSEKEMESWCEHCKKLHLMEQSREAEKLPEVLVIDLDPTSDKGKAFLQLQQGLFPRRYSQDEETVESPAYGAVKSCRYGSACNRPNCRFMGSDSELNVSSNESVTPPSTWFSPTLSLTADNNGRVSDEETKNKQEVLYELKGMVFLIKETDQEHLVSCVNVKTEEKTEKSLRSKSGVAAESPVSARKSASSDRNSGWVVFNDFVVSETSEAEAIQFSMEWKIPCLAFYCRKDMESKHRLDVVDPIDETVFWVDDCLAVRRRLSSSTFVFLEETEIPNGGDIVAMDAEFVTLNQEEAELRSDGTKSTIKPSQMSLARVSCIRGCGDMEGIPFLDDYISTQDEVVDYLTKFSGIKPGDLDPSVTSKHLTTLKSSYLKLRYLVDNGVCFVGHGLSNDFRVINILVPPEQVRDTVHLFHIPHHRMMSLRFLAWYFLDMKIQSETHDSIEDARTALKLYKKYLSLSIEGPTHFGKVLSDLYEAARKLDWKVPGD